MARLASAQDALSARSSLARCPALGEFGGAEKRGDNSAPQLSEEVQAVSRVILPLSVPEIRHLLGRLRFVPPVEPDHYLLWSLWRRVHQTLAMRYHYKKRKHNMPLLQL